MQILLCALWLLGTGQAGAQQAGDRAVLDRVYALRNGSLLWSRGGHPTAQAEALTAQLQDIGRFGLRAEDYQAANLERELHSLSTTGASTDVRWSKFDQALSMAALAVLHDLHFGRIDPRAAGFDMPARHDDFDAGALLTQLAVQAGPEAVLTEAEPQYLHYQLLRKALLRYRALAAMPAVSPLPTLSGRSMHAGQSYAGAPALRRLLARIDTLPADQAADSSPLFDEALSVALRRFQRLHGLREDGVLDRDTLAELVVPLPRRVRQIELTLERWRWLPALRPPTLIVNIPAFRLFLIRSTIDRESDMLRMNVIVGREYPQRHTPVFASDMDAVIFRPYWEVPASIAQHELLPQMRRDPGMLSAQNFELVTNDTRALAVAPTPQNLDALASGQLRLRQRPGADNALGLIKFVLPNHYDVYLHSTPAQRLFAEPHRAFSHGCVRVSDPVALATAVLEGTPGDWTPEKVRAAMNGEATFRVALARPVHVLIVYGTAIASEDGEVHFFQDIYGYDARLERLLGP